MQSNYCHSETLIETILVGEADAGSSRRTYPPSLTFATAYLGKAAVIYEVQISRSRKWCAGQLVISFCKDGFDVKKPNMFMTALLSEHCVGKLKYGKHMLAGLGGLQCAQSPFRRARCEHLQIRRRTWYPMK